MRTGCHTAIFPALASLEDGTVQMGNLYNPPGTGYLRETRWVSTDDGQSWSGIYLSGNMNFNTTSCYIGDYTAALADPYNSSYFYSWGEPSGWTIQGAVRPE